MGKATFWCAACAAALLAGGCGSGGDAADAVAACEVRGRAAWAQRDLKSAADQFAEAARLCATNFSARLSLALVACELGDVAAARAAADEALALRPDDAEALLVAGQAAHLGDDSTRAKACFDAVAQAPAVPAAMRAQAFVSQAVVEIADGASDLARLSLWRALKFDPRSAAAWYHLAYLSRNVYHFDAAAFEQYLFYSRLADPNEERTRTVVRKTIPALREALAAAAARRPGAAKRNPDAARKALAEGDAAARKKAVRVVREKYERAFALDPLSYDVARKYADFLAKDPSVNADRVLDVYRAALIARPSSGETYLAAARYALEKKRTQRAVAILSCALAHVRPSKTASSRTTVELYATALQRAGRAEDAAAYRRFLREP